MKSKTISEIKKLFEQEEITEEIIQDLKNDERKGVQAILKRYKKQKQKDEQLKEQFMKMTSYEKHFRNDGFNLIAGVDEAGRGPLAGPVVAAAVILPSDFKLYGLTDSKQLNDNQRENFYKTITREAIAYYVSVINNKKIDEINIFEATKLAMTDALNKLEPQPDYALVDAVQLNGLHYPTAPIIKGDQRSITIAAASVLAKVTRDNLMKKIHKEFPHYDFQSNMGYGTKHHIEQIQMHGISPYHRQSFAPVKTTIK